VRDGRPRRRASRVPHCAVGSAAEGRATDSYRITVGDGRTTEALVAAGAYGYAHSCVTSESFPARPLGGPRTRDVVLLAFPAAVTSAEAIARAAGDGLARPTYEEALAFGAAHPEVQRAGPVVFLHDPWIGFFGRRDVISLWENAGRRELGLADFDARWEPGHRFAFIHG
jgi:hypothetical protein